MKVKILYLLLLFSSMITAQSTASKNVHTFKIEAPQLETTKKIWVYLPAGYADSTQKYPVVYMHDAQNLFDAKTSYAGEWGVDEVLDSLNDPQVIVIGIEHGGDKRIDELTPFTNDEYGGGHGDLYLEFIRNTLKPHVDATFRTLKDRDNTSIFGSSLGGLLSFYAAFKYHDTFSKIGVFSPSFWFNEEIYDVVSNSDIIEEPKIYILAGTAESENLISEIEKMRLLLLQNGINKDNLHLEIVEGGKHNENLWRSNFKSAILWLMKN